MRYIRDMLNKCSLKCEKRISSADFMRLLNSMQLLLNLKPVLLSKCGGSQSEMELLYYALDYAAENGINITVAGAASAMNVSASSISRTLKALSSRGLIKREYDEHDRRSVRIAVTEEGETVFCEFLTFVCSVMDEAMREFTREELTQMIDLHGRLTQAIIKSIPKVMERRTEC